MILALLILFVLFVLSIYLYNTKQYVNSSLLFFFFATSGFQLIPNSIVEALPVKSGDFAILYILSVGFMQFYLGKKRFSFGLEKIDKVWGGYLLLTIALSFLIYNIDLVGIFKTTRHYLLMFSFFLFVNMKTEEVEKLKSKLLYITLMTCFFATRSVVRDDIGFNRSEERRVGKEC